MSGEAQIGLLGLVAIWWAGSFLSWSTRMRWAVSALWWIAIAALYARSFALRGIEPTQMSTAREGGSYLAGWVTLAAFALIIVGYRYVLRKLRRKSAPGSGASTQSLQRAKFTPTELDRYARHIILREIGGPGQRRLKDARVLVIGAGGLGSPLLLYLAAAGVGTIGVIDDDVVENSNLARQIIHTDARIGMPKVFSAEAAMKALNPFTEVRPYNRRLTEGIAADVFADYDLILDGSDSFDTRYLVNRVAVALGKPLISAAITQWEGQVSLYHPAGGGPCYACVFPDPPAPGMVPSCAEAGVAGPLPGVIGAIMATEAVKHLTGAGETLKGRVMIHDALYAETRVIAARPRPTCEVCGKPAP